jgi:hypothetical protein
MVVLTDAVRANGGLTREGIFRIPGDSAEIQKLKAQVRRLSTTCCNAPEHRCDGAARRSTIASCFCNTGARQLAAQVLASHGQLTAC